LGLISYLFLKALETVDFDNPSAFASSLILINDSGIVFNLIRNLISFT